MFGEFYDTSELHVDLEQDRLDDPNRQEVR